MPPSNTKEDYQTFCFSLNGRRYRVQHLVLYFTYWEDVQHTSTYQAPDIFTSVADPWIFVAFLSSPLACVCFMKAFRGLRACWWSGLFKVLPSIYWMKVMSHSMSELSSSLQIILYRGWQSSHSPRNRLWCTLLAVQCEDESLLILPGGYGKNAFARSIATNYVLQLGLLLG